MRGWIPAWLERCTCGTEKSYKADGEILAEFTPSEALSHVMAAITNLVINFISNNNFGSKFDYLLKMIYNRNALLRFTEVFPSEDGIQIQ